MTRLLLALAFALLPAAAAHPQNASPPYLPASGLELVPGYGPDSSVSAPIVQACPPVAADCAHGPRCWANAEYVFWTIGTGKLLEAGKAGYNSDLFNSLLDASGKNYRDLADTLLGDDRTGFRLSAGGWLDADRTVGVEASFLYVDRGPLVLNLGRRDLNPVGSLVRRLGLPGIDAAGRPVIVPLGRRDLVDGSARFEIADQTLWVLDLGGRARLFESGGLTADGLVGYRRVYYRDSLAVRSEVTTLAAPLLPGTRLRSVDLIQAENTYDGVLFGVDVAAQMGSWTVAVRPTATVAAYRSEVTRAGVTTVTFPDDRPRLGIAAGTYLRSSDLGTFTTTGWTILPEIGLRASRSLGESVRLTFGSSLLYIPEAARAAPQFEIGLDPARTLPGAVGTRQGRNVNPPELRSAFLSTMSVGLEFRF